VAGNLHRTLQQKASHCQSILVGEDSGRRRWRAGLHCSASDRFHHGLLVL